MSMADVGRITWLDVPDDPKATGPVTRQAVLGPGGWKGDDARTLNLLFSPRRPPYSGPAAGAFGVAALQAAAASRPGGRAEVFPREGPPDPPGTVY